ncbi:MotA/TolQ/ExbB proton channel family protein [Pseudomonas tolaasii]|uniref:MotA/TolQ/ExbB proton channel family protein n=2 Tax=Pseudomonas tolaasii TaxID=29442 RepID=A0A7Y8DSY3_PSETO|nr:MotA/TolQ/ExbB proton channel family protein [Pseudomonas tolaasii]ARB26457.1 hypothetical protein B5P22_03890 [Pseudomonas tolaasii]KAB0475672.1 hypothetical protein F7R12_14085 [Pseudomonas tolaasii]MBY8943863.1 MotA/TolQ/ExbB proton channel family protein [Pseudomonas tolaasii]NWC24493.1 MotA/TolQ/ExbB proton channel family protein [Pseudomonas tolaasii]NWC40114.1 MotA/TolQ/ExbB proton channel family protein [Pseudomonas tolaasii]
MKGQHVVHQVKAWFMIALIIKVACAFISYKLSDALWSGFWIPVAVMASYCFIGYRVRERYDTRLTIAKFADSAYYLGFLFTVGSIIVCLADIQSIGENLSNMAGRFSAAMVSTAIGMVVRTYLVGFRPDQDDAVTAVEERAISASERLILMFDDTYSKLEMFRDEVVGTTKETMTAAKQQIEELSKHSMNAMDAYFANATQRSNDTFDAMLKDAKTASGDLLSTINGLADKSEQTLERMESHALDFGNLAQRRLEQTLFPDDLFANKLKPSIDTLAQTSDGVNSSISELAEDVKAAARSVGTAIRGLNTKTQALEDTAGAVGSIVESQGRLLDAMNSQSSGLVEGIERVQKEFLDTLDDYQKEFQQVLISNREVIEKVVDRLQTLNEKIDSDDTTARLIQDIDEAFKASDQSNIRANEALSESINSTLMPLIQAVAGSNETHKALATQLEHGNRTIDAAHAQLNELLGKIDGINQIEIRLPAVTESVLSPSAEPMATSIVEPAAFDARPA